MYIEEEMSAVLKLGNIVLVEIHVYFVDNTITFDCFEDIVWPHFYTVHAFAYPKSLVLRHVLDLNA